MNDNNILISIITVCFNSEKTINQTLESVLNQSYNNIEYILIDGGSSDNTLNIIKSYADKFNAKGMKYKYISEPDNGLYDAMNKGVKLANGEWVGIINSDDWYELDACEIIVKNIEPNIDVLHGLCAYYENINNKLLFILLSSHSAEAMYYSNLAIEHPTVFIRKNVYEEFQFSLKYKLAADLDILMNIFVRGHKFKLVQEKISNFRLGGISTIRCRYSELESNDIRYKFKRINWLKYYRTKFIILFKILLKW
jgi:glycosyltransferase involved in cell wall biosynthesis